MGKCHLAWFHFRVHSVWLLISPSFFVILASEISRAMPSTGKYLIALGIVTIVIGLIVWLFGNKFNWFGNLPGDIKIEKENFKVYIPITSMLLISAVLSLFFLLFRKFF